MQDPYVYPGSKTLINKLDIRDAEKLQDVESAFYIIKLAKPLPAGHLNYSHLKAIHRHLFGDLYPWAGEERIVSISKGGNLFALPGRIEPYVSKTFDLLTKDNHLKHLDLQQFSKKAAYYFNEVNAVHPFREGNGRTLRTFFDTLANQAGYHLDWSRVQRDFYIKASIDGFNGEHTQMEKVFSLISHPLDRKQSLKIDTSQEHNKTHIDVLVQTILSSEAKALLSDYAHKQVELAHFVREKNVHLSSNISLSKEYAKKAHILDKEMIVLANTITADKTAIELLKLASKEAWMTAKNQRNFDKIRENMNKGIFVAQDTLTIIKHAKERGESISQSLEQERSLKGKSR